MSKAALAKKNALPLKEAGLFKELLSQYENRLLKKGLKTAEQILKKFPEHGGRFSVTKQTPQKAHSPIIDHHQRHYA